MMFLRTILSLILFLGIIACDEDLPKRKPYVDLNNSDLENTDYNVLFVGNSLTFTNDLPYLVKTKAASKGINVGITTIAKGNYALIDHWSEGAVQEQINSKKYDFVVVQQGPSSTAVARTMLIEDGKAYSELCKSNNTQLCYFMVWPSLTYYHTFEGVIKNYTDAAEANDATLLPVGVIWKKHFDQTESFDYYGSDGFHPSELGSNAAADVMVSKLF